MTTSLFGSAPVSPPPLVVEVMAQTVTAPQALLMLNGEFSVQQAKALAERLTSKTSDMREIIRAAYNSVLCRAPTDEDLSRAEFFIRQQSERIATDGPAAADATAVHAAIVDLCHALLNCAEFVNIE